jgi:hypothetical protein
MSKRCDKSFECEGYCWLNVAGDYDLWYDVAKKCKGTLKEQKLNDDYFNGRVDKKELIDFYVLEKMTPY